jgi:arylsulfatase A-like enzyme
VGLVGAAERVNVVLIVVDDLGWRDLGCYGSGLYRTPHIDRLASQGVRFTDAYSAHPRCVPSRVGLMTGKYPSRLGVPGATDRSLIHAMPLRETTVGEAMREGGYRTGFIGKWHLGKDGGGPAAQGFEVSIAAGAAGAPASYHAPYLGKSKEPVMPDVTGAPKGEFLTDRLSAEAVGFIEKHQDGLFFLVLSHYAVHTPIEGKKEYVEAYEKALGKPFSKNAKIANDVVGAYKTTQNHPVYAALVQSVDDSVGRVMATIERLGLSERTVVMLTSDHGGLSSRGQDSKRELATSNLPLRHGKGWIYEGGVRVPLIVKWPGVTKAGAVSDAVVTGTDHFPTILEMGGMDSQPKHHLDGVSYTPALRGDAHDRGAIFWHSPLGRPTQTGDVNGTAMRLGHYKLIEWYDDEVVELFDLSADIGERENLVEKNPRIAKRMLDELRAWRKKTAKNENLHKHFGGGKP